MHCDVLTSAMCLSCVRVLSVFLYNKEVLLIIRELKKGIGRSFLCVLSMVPLDSNRQRIFAGRGGTELLLGIGVHPIRCTLNV